MPPDQYLRELVVNGCDAGAGRIVIDAWLEPATGRNLVRVSDDGGGMGRDDLIGYLSQLHVDSGKGEANYGVGARLATLSRNHAGVTYASRTASSGECLVRLVREHDNYGMTQWPVTVDGYDQVEEVVVAENGELSRAGDEHGTAVILHGDGTADTWSPIRRPRRLQVPRRAVLPLPGRRGRSDGDDAGPRDAAGGTLRRVARQGRRGARQRPVRRRRRPHRRRRLGDHPDPRRAAADAGPRGEGGRRGRARRGRDLRLRPESLVRLRHPVRQRREARRAARRGRGPHDGHRPRRGRPARRREDPVETHRPPLRRPYAARDRRAARRRPRVGRVVRRGDGEAARRRVAEAPAPGAGAGAGPRARRAGGRREGAIRCRRGRSPSPARRPSRSLPGPRVHGRRPGRGRATRATTRRATRIDRSAAGRVPRARGYGRRPPVHHPHRDGEPGADLRDVPAVPARGSAVVPPSSGRGTPSRSSATPSRPRTAPSTPRRSSTRTARSAPAFPATSSPG